MGRWTSAAKLGFGSSKEKKNALPLANTPAGMKIRVAHENKAADLVMMDGETMGGLRKSCHSIFKIAYDRQQLIYQDKLMTEPDSVTLVKAGIPDGAVITVTVSAPVVVKKAAPATPLEAIEREEAEVARLKNQLDTMLGTVTGAWKDKLPEVSVMDKMEWDCKGVDELLTQVLLRLDNIESGAELRERRRAVLKMTQALQDGSVACVREAVNVHRDMAAKAAEEAAKEAAKEAV